MIQFVTFAVSMISCHRGFSLRNHKTYDLCDCLTLHVCRQEEEKSRYNRDKEVNQIIHNEGARRRRTVAERWCPPLQNYKKEVTCHKKEVTCSDVLTRNTHTLTGRSEALLGGSQSDPMTFERCNAFVRRSCYI